MPVANNLRLNLARAAANGPNAVAYYADGLAQGIDPQRPHFRIRDCQDQTWQNTGKADGSDLAFATANIPVRLAVATGQLHASAIQAADNGNPGQAYHDHLAELGNAIPDA